jgi:hypothetical protein
VLTVELRADAITFLGLPYHQAQSLDLGGVTITGSNTLVLNPVDTPNGLGVLGGIPGFTYRDWTIDPTESVTFHFDSGPVTNVVLTPQILGTIGNTSIANEGESLVTAFGAAGQSLGTVDLLPSASGLREFDISAAFGNQLISSFVYQPAGDAVNGNFATLAGLSFDPSPFHLPPAIPEPSSVIGWGLGVLITMRQAFRHRWRRTPRTADSHRLR